LSDPKVMVGFILVGAVLGGLVSLIAFLPSVRRLARRGGDWHWMVALMFGLLPFALFGGAWTRAGAQSDYDLSSVFVWPFDTPDLVYVADERRETLLTELWARGVVPPPWQGHCFTGDAQVCALADVHAGSGDWLSYLGGWGVAAAMGLASGGLAWRHTREPAGERS
jgi:hypothetical protein